MVSKQKVGRESVTPLCPPCQTWEVPAHCCRVNLAAGKPQWLVELDEDAQREARRLLTPARR